MAIVVFDYAMWALRYPELANSVSQPLAQMYFNEAGLCCDNSDTSPIVDLTARVMLLNMATAHIAALNATLNGKPSSPIVGRISDATEGTVSVSTENLYQRGTAQWWQQTKYGAQWWQATGQYRRGRLFPGAVRNFDPYNPMGPAGGFRGI
jgi:hypothetical protein